MKKAKTIQPMRIYRQESKPSRDIMDNQDNTNRGDGTKPMTRVMTTFQMDKDLKEQLRDYCRSRGLKQGEFINNAIRKALEE